MRLRIFFAFLLIVLVTAAGVVLVTGWRLKTDISRFLNRGGLSGTDLLVEELENHYELHGTWTGAERLVLASPGGAGGPGGPWGPGGAQPVTVADTEGAILFTTFPLLVRGGSENLQEGEIPKPPTHLTKEELEAAIPLNANGQVVGYLLSEFRVPVPTWIETDLFARLNRSAMIAAGIAVFLSALLASLLAFFLLRPIRELTLAAQAMGAGDLDQRVLLRGGRETVLLATTFNQMAASLQAAEKRRKALTADIAHELRNPLAIQRANLEALQDGHYPLTVENLDPVVHQNLLLERLVEDLRTLAIADAGEMRLEFTPTDLPALLDRRVAELAPEAAARAVEIRTVLPTDCPPAEVDPARIGQIILNLLRNALEHTPSGGWVETRLTCGLDAVEIRVRDSGPGIPADDLPHIFERFFRGDKSRERLRGATGLGLSIARQLALAHGGSLTASNHPEGGALFIVTLPIARTSG